jgi:hypothetical protein
MVAKQSLLTQLRALGLHFKVFGRYELKEMQRLLRPGEQVHACVHGYYQGGTCLLAATDQRLLLIDRRPFYVNIEDMHYPHINELAFTRKFMHATMYIRLGGKRLIFRSFSDANLHSLFAYTEQQVELSKHDSALFTQQVEPNRTSVRHPAWTPHTPYMIRTKPSKFHALGHTALHQ